MTRRPEVPRQTSSPGAENMSVQGEVSDFEEVFNHLPDPAFIFDKATLRYLAVNEAAISIRRRPIRCYCLDD